MSTRPIVPMAKQLKPDDYTYSVDAPPLPPANPKGMISPGNINVFDRPIVPNPDGGSSTVYSASFGTDKGETLVPRVSDGADKRPPHIMSNPEALNYFKKTGQSLGTFDNPDDADAYANGLHEQQAKLGSFNGRTTLPQLIHKTPLEQPELVSANMGGVPNIGNAPTPQIAKMPTPSEQQIQSDQGQLQKVRWAQDNPWGTANNHPGKVGKIAHVLSTAANIAGDIFAPGITANIPGSQLNMQEREGSLAKRLNAEISDEAVNQEHGAQQGHLEQETANAPIEAADKHNLAGATAEHLGAETQALQTPSLATAYAHAVQEAIKKGQDPSTDPIVMHLSDAIVGLQPGQNKTPTLHYETTVGPDGKPHVYGLDEKGAKVADEGEHYEKPMSVNVNPGTWSLQNDTEGKPLLFNSKTGETREAPANLARKPNAEEIKRNDLAGNVNENLNTLQEILTRRPELFGPVAGRMTKAREYVGTSDPDVAALKTIEDNLGMALQSAHGMRSAQHVATSAESVLNGLKNSPAALSAAIKTARNSVGTFQHDVQNTNEAGSGGGAPQMIRAVDDKGVLHEAPAGTPLPKGWKAQ